MTFKGKSLFNHAHDSKESSTPLRGLETMTDIAEVRPLGRFRTGSNRFDESTIRIGIGGIKNRSVKTSMTRPQVRLTFGANVIATLRWQESDRIQVLFDNEYIFVHRHPDGLYMLRRHSGGRGNKSRLGISFLIYPPMPFSDNQYTISAHPADFIYQDDGVLIAWPDKSGQE